MSKENQDNTPKEETSKSSPQEAAPKSNRSLLVARIARVGAVTAALGVAVGIGIFHLVRFDIVGAGKAAADVVSTALKAADPIVKLSRGGKIEPTPGIYSKLRDKVRTLPGGKAVANTVDTTYKILSSRAPKRLMKLAGIVTSAIVTPPPLGIGLAALSMSAVAYNVGKEILEVREEKHLENEKNSLTNIQNNKQLQSELLKEKLKTVEPNSNLDQFLQQQLSNVNIKPSDHTEKVAFQGNEAVEGAKAVYNNLLETAALIASSVAKGPVNMVLAAGVALVNVTGEVDDKLVRLEKKHDLTNQINDLKLNTLPYKDRAELKDLDRQEQINQKALEEFIQPKNIENFKDLTKEEIQHIFNENKKEVADRQEFAPPAERTNFEKAKSAVKAGAGYFVDSQFGDLIKLHNANKKTQDVQPSSPSAKPEPERTKSTEIVKEKIQEKAHHMQESLTHGKVSAYKPSVSSPSATPAAQAHNKHNESSRG